MRLNRIFTNYVIQLVLNYFLIVFVFNSAAARQCWSATETINFFEEISFAREAPECDCDNECSELDNITYSGPVCDVIVRPSDALFTEDFEFIH